MMRLRGDISFAICGRGAAKVEAKLDGTRIGLCNKHAPRGDMVHEMLRRLRLKQAAKRFLRKPLHTRL
jgi:hypothetical protein